MITVEDFNGVPDVELTNWFEDILVNKKELTGKCWKELYYAGMLNEIETVADFNNAGRWYIPVNLIFEFNNNFYSIWYDRGLTEHQENEWEDQSAVPVKKVEVKSYQWVAC